MCTRRAIQRPFYINQDAITEGLYMSIATLQVRKKVVNYTSQREAVIYIHIYGVAYETWLQTTGSTDQLRYAIFYFSHVVI